MKKDVPNSDKPIIRPLLIDDYDALINLWDNCRLPYKPLGRDSRVRLEAEMLKETALFLTAERDGRLIGVVLGTHDGRKAWVNRLAVHPDFQNQGIAAALLEKLEEMFRERGFDVFACLIEDYNQVSMQFFQKNGYLKKTEVLYFVKKNFPDA